MLTQEPADPAHQANKKVKFDAESQLAAALAEGRPLPGEQQPAAVPAPQQYFQLAPQQAVF